MAFPLPCYLIFSFLNRQKQVTGEYSLTALLDSSQAVTSGMAQNLSLRACNLGKLSTAVGKNDATRFNISYTTKSMIEKYPKYHPSAGHQFSQSRRMGCILFQKVEATLRGFSWKAQMSPSMALFRSCLLFMLSTLILSARVRPMRSLLPAFSMRYRLIAAGPVTTKAPSLRQGRSLKVQSLAQVSLYLLHWSGVKKRSSQSMCSTSQRRRATCAFARTGQYPSYSLTVKVLWSSRLYGRISKNIIILGAIFDGWGEGEQRVNMR